MKLREREAKEKVCPQRLTIQNAYANKCVASDCMAWRWDDPTNLGVNRNGYCGLAGKVDFK
jgi:hypothetical protein